MTRGTLFRRLMAAVVVAVYAISGVAIAPVPVRAEGTVITWRGTAGDGQWETASNWDQERVPQAGDTVKIPIASEVQCAGTDEAVSLDCEGQLTLTGGILTLTGTSYLKNGKIDGGGSIAIAGEGSQLKWTDGEILGAGGFSVESGASLEVGLPSVKTLARPVSCAGDVFVVNPGTTLRLTGGGQVDGDIELASFTSLNIDGGNYFFNGTVSGTDAEMDVKAGSVQFNGTHGVEHVLIRKGATATWAVDSVLAGIEVLSVYVEGNAVFNNDAPISMLAIIGGQLSGSGQISLVGWENKWMEGGVIEGTGELRIASTESLHITDGVCTVSRHVTNLGKLLVGSDTTTCSVEFLGGISGTGGLNVQAGSTVRLGGTGSYAFENPGQVVNNGEFVISDSCSEVKINTSFSQQQDTGTLTFDIGGPDSFCKLEVQDQALINNSHLRINLVDGYVPEEGSTFEIMNYGSCASMFSSITSNGEGIVFVPTYGANSLTLTVAADEEASSEAQIISYSLPGQAGSATIDPEAGTIAITVPYMTDLTSLEATFTLSSGAGAKVGELAQESGITVNDFTDPVTYTVTAEDGTTTKVWSVTVTSEPGFAGGDGTDSNPYLVETAAHLNNVRYHLDAHFRQEADINLNVAPYSEGEGWVPISTRSGHQYSFTGTYDGNNKTITGLYINQAGTTRVSLFGSLAGATIKDLTLADVQVLGSNMVGGLAGFVGPLSDRLTQISGVHVTTGTVRGTSSIGGFAGELGGSDVVESSSGVTVVGDNGFIGGFIGYISSAATVDGCSATGTVTVSGTGAILDVGGFAGCLYGATLTGSSASGTVTGKDNVGGFLGINQGTVSGCFASGAVEGEDNVGGLIGCCNGGTVSGSFATGSVEGSGTSAGGLVGKNEVDGEIEDCYASGAVSGSIAVGGLAGQFTSGSIRNCYATGTVTGTSLIGGLVGICTGDCTDCYWDTETSGRVSSAGDGAVGRTTAQMKQQTTYVGWDFEETWGLHPSQNAGYPFLIGITEVGPVVPGSEAQILEFRFSPSDAVVIDNAAGSVEVLVDSGTDVTDLVATFTLSFGANAAVGGVAQVSGVTALDFTSPVTYTVTAEDGTTRNWVVTVTKREAPDADAVALDKAALTWDVIAGENTRQDNIIGDLVNPLPTSGANGTTISWSVSPGGFIDTTTGEVTRPESTEYDQTVTLTATISKGEASDTVSFTLTVVALPTPPPSGGYIPAYVITVNAGPGGTIAPKTTTVLMGASVTFSVSPDDGYEVLDVLVDGESVGALTTYTFEDVTRQHSISATFGRVFPFEDVSENDWFYSSVRYVFESDLMTGTAEGEFSPLLATNRAMIVTILHRLESAPDAPPESFTDVPDGAWYAEAVAWADANGIAEGFGDGRFGPEVSVTREQIACFFYRYCLYAGRDVSVRASLAGFVDGDQTSEWAREAMEWAVGCGLIRGKDGNVLDPTGPATRAELAAILERFIEGD